MCEEVVDPRDEQDGIAQIDFESNGDDTPDLMHECYRNQIPGIHRADESCEHDKEWDSSDKKDRNKRKEARGKDNAQEIKRNRIRRAGRQLRSGGGFVRLRSRRRGRHRL